MKKIFIITIFSIFFFVLVAFLTVQFVNNQTVPHKENIQENLTKVNAVENEIKVTSPIVETAQAAQNETEEPLLFSYPVSGEIGLSHSPESLIFSKTLQEWTTHTGIDIQAKRGTPVAAAEEGIVKNITETAAKGIEITLAHKDGYKTVYSNLSTKEMVKVGQVVEKGRIISGIGNTASFEYYEPEHLHFEVYKNNKAIDPLEILTENVTVQTTTI